MKEIKIKKTKLTVYQLKGAFNPRSEDNETLDYTGIIEVALDLPPQGGFTPSDIRARNRIQDAIDKKKDGKIDLEDADYDNLVKIIKSSRWGTRDKELGDFLEQFKEK